MNLQDLKYFQKSKVFIYPLLGIPRGNHIVPTATFLQWEDRYSISDRCLLVLYELDYSSTSLSFEEFLISNPLFSTAHPLPSDKDEDEEKRRVLYVFDISKYAKDYDHFVNGSYSKISKEVKDSISQFFSNNEDNRRLVLNYLYPKPGNIEKLARLLNVSSVLITETCESPDIERETLRKDEL